MKRPTELKEESASGPEQAVIIHVNRVDFDQMTALENELIEILDSSGVGAYDGNEVGRSETTLWMYGRDARELYRCIIPTLGKHEFSSAARITIRFGEVGAQEEELQFDQNSGGTFAS